MLCGNCKKNQATKTYEQVKKGRSETEYYCLDCYQKLFVQADGTDGNTPSACPYCGTTVAEFKKRNLVGCAYCYTALKHAVYPVVKKMQGGQAHTGKHPFGGTGVEKRLAELRSLAQKSRAEGNKLAAREYEEQYLLLERNGKEDYVWRKHPDLSKRL